MSTKKIAILGGGISGLATAYKLLKKDAAIKITLIDKQDRVGGWIKTIKFPKEYFETGPRSLRPDGLSGLTTLNLVDELGLSSQVLKVSKEADASKNRYLYFDNQLNKLPSSIPSMLMNKSKLLKGIIKSGILEPFQKKNDKDETIEEFISRRFNQQIANNLISAIVRGVYAGDINQLSITNTLGILKQYEKQYGSIVLGILMNMFKPMDPKLKQQLNELKEKNQSLYQVYKTCSMYSFKHGIQQLSDTLLNELNKNSRFELKLNQNIKHIKVNDTVKVELDNQIIEYDHIISCIPSNELYNLIDDNQLEMLNFNPFSSVAVVNMSFENKVMPFNGFGYLVPKSVTTTNTIGVVYDSCPFPQLSSNETCITVMIGGPRFRQLGTNPTKESIFNYAIQTIQQHLNIHSKPVNHFISIQNNCIPQYLVNHHIRMNQLHNLILKKYNNKLFLLGASYNGAAINDCIFYADQLVNNLIKDGILSKDFNPKFYSGLEKYA